MDEIKKPSFFDQIIQGAKDAVDDVKGEIAQVAEAVKADPLKAVGMGALAMTGIGAIGLKVYGTGAKLVDEFQNGTSLKETAGFLKSVGADPVSFLTRKSLTFFFHRKVDEGIKAAEFLGARGMGAAASAGKTVVNVGISVRQGARAATLLPPRPVSGQTAWLSIPKTAKLPSAALEVDQFGLHFLKRLNWNRSLSSLLGDVQKAFSGWGLKEDLKILEQCVKVLSDPKSTREAADIALIQLKNRIFPRYDQRLKTTAEESLKRLRTEVPEAPKIPSGSGIQTVAPRRVRNAG